MGDDLLKVPGGGQNPAWYPPVGTTATIEVAEGEMEFLNRAGRYGWRGVAQTTWTWTLEFTGAQWAHARTFRRPPAGEGWQRIGRWLWRAYWARPLHLPMLPGNPEPEAFRSEKKLRRALARSGAAPSPTSSAVAGFLEGVRDVVNEVAHAVDEALGTSVGGASAPGGSAHLPAPEPGRPAPLPAVVDPRLFDASDAGQRLRENVTRLAHWIPVYAGYAIGGEPVSGRLERLVADMQDLLRRMHAQGSAHQLAVAQAHYAHLLNQLVLVVAPTYLKDVMDNPHLWDDAEQRVLRVSSALTVLDAEILDNVRRVNTSADLDFQVALATITGLADDGGLDALYRGPTT